MWQPHLPLDGQSLASSAGAQVSNRKFLLPLMTGLAKILLNPNASQTNLDALSLKNIRIAADGNVHLDSTNLYRFDATKKQGKLDPAAALSSICLALAQEASLFPEASWSSMMPQWFSHSSTEEARQQLAAIAPGLPDLILRTMQLPANSAERSPARVIEAFERLQSQQHASNTDFVSYLSNVIKTQEALRSWDRSNVLYNNLELMVGIAPHASLVEPLT